MRTFGIRGMMPESDEPLIGIGVEVRLQPIRHRAVRRPALGHRVKANKVEVGVVERIVLLCAGGDTAGFTVGWTREDIEIGEPAAGIGAVRLVIANGRPWRYLPQHGRKYAEEVCLKLVISSI